MPTGNGAYVVHRLIARSISNYRVIGFNPYLTLFPFLLRPTISCRDAQIIHSAPDYAIFFYAKTVPLIVTFHNYVLDRWMRPYSTWLQRIHYKTDLKLWIRMAIHRARQITAVSQYTAQLIQKELRITKPIQVIYNGVNVNHFQPQRGSRKNQKNVRVFFSGNLSRRKGIQFLPAIARQLAPNIQIHYTKGLRTPDFLSSENALISVGRIPFDDMPNRYCEMDILIMPTVREGFGLAVAEAMACGLPVVASNCSSMPELIDHNKGGYLCPVGDVKEFAEKINYLAESPAIRRQMGEYNRLKVEETFSLERMVKEYKALFEQIQTTS